MPKKYTHSETVDIKYILLTIPMLFSSKCFKTGYITQLENKFKEFIGTKYAIATSSGRHAIHLILKSLNIEKEKDEIIVPALMPKIVAGVLVNCGLKPVFVDIDPETLNINPDEIEKHITKNTKYILIVHLHGIPCGLDRIMEIVKKHNLFLIEDCAQAFNSAYKGKKVGSFGHASIFSFSMYKNYNTCGGGMIFTNDKFLNDRVREEVEKLPNPSRRTLFKFTYAALFQSSLKFPFLTFAFFRPLTFLFVELKFLSKNWVDDFLFMKTSIISRKSFFDEKIFLKLFGVKYTNYQAKQGLIQINDKKFWKKLEQQDRNVNLFHKHINKFSFLSKDITPSYYFCYTLVKYPQEVINQLSKLGVKSFITRYPIIPEKDNFSKYKSDCPISKKVHQNIIYLPFRHPLKDQDMMNIINRFKKINPELLKIDDN